MTFPKLRAGTGPGGPRGVTQLRACPLLPRTRTRTSLWETACYEGNTESLAGIRALGYKWVNGVTPPK